MKFYKAGLAPFLFIFVAILSFVPALAAPGKAEPVPTLYLHLTGTFPTEAATLMAQIKKELTEPLQSLKGKALFSYIDQVSGDGSFILNLTLSPIGTVNLIPFNQYVETLEKSGFKGLVIHFKQVMRIVEMPEFQVGTYVGTSEDPFQKNFQLSRHFVLGGLKEWTDFSNEYGFALLGPSSGFLAYVEKFVGDAAEFEKLKHVLAQNNMVAVNPKPVLILEGGEVVGPQPQVSPFIAYRFFRNCYAKAHENGSCYTF
jgi:hypothetical protein